MALAVALHLLPLACGAALIDPDEGLHAAIAREMVEDGHWIVPRFRGEVFLDKPILYFWALASSVSVLGPTELGVRLPGSLFALAGALTTGLLARTVIGASSFAPAVFVATTLSAPFAVMLAPVHDIALVPWTNLALLAFWRREHDALAHVGWTVGAGVALGLALLTKGLSGVALVGLAWGLYLLTSRRITGRTLIDGTAALCVAAVVASPWYAAAEASQPGYLNYFFIQRHFLGFTTTTQTHGLRPWWFYVPVVVAGSLPWVGYLWPARAPFDQHSPSAGRISSRRLLWLWLGSNLVFLSAAGSKLLTYALPVFPAVALLVVSAWRAGARKTPSLVGPVIEGATVAALPIGAALSAYAFASVSASRSLALVAWGVIGLVAWRAAVRRTSHSLGLRASVVAAIYAGVLITLYGPVADAYSARSLARHLNESPQLPQRLFVFDERLGSLLFYLTPELREQATTDRVLSVDFGELRREAARVSPGDVVAFPNRSLPLVGRSLPTETVSFTAVNGRYRLYSAPEVLRPSTAESPPH